MLQHTTGSEHLSHPRVCTLLASLFAPFLTQPSPFEDRCIQGDRAPHECPECREPKVLGLASAARSWLCQYFGSSQVQFATGYPDSFRDRALFGGNVSPAALLGTVPIITCMAREAKLHGQGLVRHHYFNLLDATTDAWSQEERDAERKRQVADRHSQHCMAYLAQSILCSADLTIEWAKIERDGSRLQVDGWGIPHQCKDPGLVWDWMLRNHGPLKEPDIHLSD